MFISFSGGKESALLLQLVIDYKKRNNLSTKIGVFNQDFESQYQVTTEFVEEIFEKYISDIEPYWVCLPMDLRTSLSNYQLYWYLWDDKNKDIWIGNFPDKPYVIHIENNPFYLYKYRML
ncbi:MULTISPECIES: hypothetical protein [Clostridia]|uniref:hypothetical protein n=1 Tax=Clostridia TaxID=186801 RepID=UPI0005E91E7E|nr:hypothetical protein [Paeniclostridium sordellii]MDG6893376.1 hypothetical protein [Clostridium perfringens]CEP83397.1 Predicted phosphoadenosine phosphosulfate sulfotransferase [[Clostridium] sordellii] [Paeniclostridium sordellii]